MAAMAEQQVARIEGNHLVSERVILICTILPHVVEPKPIKVLRVFVDGLAREKLVHNTGNC